MQICAVSLFTFLENMQIRAVSLFPLYLYRLSRFENIATSQRSAAIQLSKKSRGTGEGPDCSSMKPGMPI